MSHPHARRIAPGEKVRLADLPTELDSDYEGRDDPAYVRDFAEAIERLADLQERLYAEATRAVLVVLQAPDAAGKDGVLRKVCGPLDSRGVFVWSFKAPNNEELAHDYLWRLSRRLPRRGELTVFNRSHYEDILVPRVMRLVPETTWKKRYAHINAFEERLHDEGTRVLKVFLHISKAEQLRRFRERVEDPAKHWKFDPADLEARARWDDYHDAYEDIFARTSTDHAPWHLVPADKKWLRDLAFARLLGDTLADLDPHWPAPRFDPRGVKLE